MKKLFLVLVIALVASLKSVYGQDYYIQLSGIQREEKLEEVLGGVLLWDNEFAGVDFNEIPNLGYEERIRCDKSGFIKREGFFLFKEGKGMKTNFLYKIGVKTLDEEVPNPSLKWVMVEMSVISYTGSMSLKFKGLLQQVAL